MLLSASSIKVRIDSLELMTNRRCSIYKTFLLRHLNQIILHLGTKKTLFSDCKTAVNLESSSGYE